MKQKDFLVLKKILVTQKSILGKKPSEIASFDIFSEEEKTIIRSIKLLLVTKMIRMFSEADDSNLFS